MAFLRALAWQHSVGVCSDQPFREIKWESSAGGKGSLEFSSNQMLTQNEALLIFLEGISTSDRVVHTTFRKA